MESRHVDVQEMDAAIMNGGGIRGGKIFEPGTAITRRDILSELPFGNHLVTVDIKGRALWNDLENGLSRLPAAAGRFPQVSGLRIEFDPQRPPGSRVLSIAVGDKPLDPDRTYRVATNDFMTRGGDDYSGRLTADALTFYGLAGAAFAHHVTIATRASTSSPFGAPKAINLTIDADIITPFVTPDGGSLYFSSNVTGNWCALTWRSIRTLRWPRFSGGSIRRAARTCIFRT